MTINDQIKKRDAEIVCQLKALRDATDDPKIRAQAVRLLRQRTRHQAVRRAGKKTARTPS